MQIKQLYVFENKLAYICMTKEKAEKEYIPGCSHWLKSKDWDEKKGGITRTPNMSSLKQKKHNPTKL